MFAEDYEDENDGSVNNLSFCNAASLSCWGSKTKPCLIMASMEDDRIRVLDFELHYNLSGYKHELQTQT